MHGRTDENDAIPPERRAFGNPSGIGRGDAPGMPSSGLKERVGFRLDSEMRLGAPTLRVKDLDAVLSFYERDVGLTVRGKIKDEDGLSAVELGFQQAAEPILRLKHDAVFKFRNFFNKLRTFRICFNDYIFLKSIAAFDQLKRIPQFFKVKVFNISKISVDVS